MMDILQELNDKEYTAGLYNDYEIRFARIDEHDELSMFLKEHWKADHIFVLSKEIFDFQHLENSKGIYNYVIAKEKETGEIHAALGFIPTSHYDENIKNTMVWPCIWKSRDDIKRKGLGVTMYYHLKSSIDIETISIQGISEIALSIYKHWNFTTGKLEHYILPNFDLEQNMAINMDIIKPRKNEEDDIFTLCEIEGSDIKKITNDNPIFLINNRYKSRDYYYNRFVNHPKYKYSFLKIEDNKNIIGIIIARACTDGQGNYCSRIVDYVGDIKRIIGVKKQLYKYIQDKNYEYLDFVEAGIADNVLEEAGFYNRRNYPTLIVPGYFEPFVQKNIDLDYAYKTVLKDYKPIFYKADSDQDRPNVL